jgi:acetyl esterase/lipase
MSLKSGLGLVLLLGCFCPESPGRAAQEESNRRPLSPPESSAPPPRAGIARRMSDVPDAARIEKDITYGMAGGIDLKMDLYFPRAEAEKPSPVALYVHGGGWRAGDKATGAGIMAVPELLRRRYVVAAINYRLAPKHKFPAQIEDAKCAVRFLRAQAGKYQLDPDRIGAFGGSAGGHLVALLGLADVSAGLEGQGGWSNQSSRVQAVVDMFGPTDLQGRVGRGGGAGIGAEVFGAASADDPVLRRASPVAYVSSNAPPFLLLHGDQDPVVPLAHSIKLHERLKAAGANSTLVVVSNAGHGFAPSAGDIRPSRAELSRIIGDFFDQHLRKP